MSLIFGHLIYTSFPQGGLRLLTSEGVSLDIREVFIDRMTKHWIAQGPPKPGYRCAYIHQIAAEKTLLGWIYNDAIQEDARKGHVPYFIGYFLIGRLNPAKLKNIFALLEQGPPSDIDRQNPPEHLEPVVAPDLWDYQSKRPGVAPPPQIYERSCRTLEKGGLIDYLPFIYAPATDLPLTNTKEQAQQPSAPVASNLGQVSRSLQNTFQDLPWKPLLGVAAVCVAAITISLSFIFSPASNSDLTTANFAPNFNESKDTAYATDGDPRSKFSPEAITEQSLESARQIAAQTEKPLASQRTNKLTQSVEARAKERLAEGTTASGVPKAPKLSKKLAAALEKEPPPLSAREKARLSTKSKLRAKRTIAQNPVLKNDRLRSKPASQPPSTVVIDSSREAPLKRPEPAPIPSASITPSSTAPDCYGTDRQSAQCRNRKN